MAVGQEDDDGSSASLSMPIGELCGNPIYMLLVMTISSLYFVVSGLQFWITTYMTTVIGVPQSEVFTYYIITCLSAPSSGVILSIFIFNWIGGYNSKYSVAVCLAFGLVAVLMVLSLVPLFMLYSPVGMIKVIIYLVRSCEHTILSWICLSDGSTKSVP